MKNLKCRQISEYSETTAIYHVIHTLKTQKQKETCKLIPIVSELCDRMT